MDNSLTERTWAEISLSNLECNYRALRGLLPAGCRFLGVVKADAYGHGAVPVARKLVSLGAECLAVACVEEGRALRRAGIEAPVLILGHTPAAQAALLPALDLTQTIFDRASARICSDAALAAGKRLRVHLKADTGMTRLGFPCDEAHWAATAEHMAEIAGLPGLFVEGIYTHFAASDTEPIFTRLQLNRFLQLLSLLETDYGIRPPIRHCANSAATLLYPETHLDMVRPGIALYGCSPAPEAALPVPLHPVMSLKSRLISVRDAARGATVGYGRTHTMDMGGRIGVVAAGYADGLPRAASDKLPLLVRGRRTRVLGRICMDMSMVDLSQIPEAKAGDPVTIFSPALPVEAAAEAAGTISYELLCAVSPRVPRRYDSGI